jgi:glycosyltransferase involved in cell wall biosynthesis
MAFVIPTPWAGQQSLDFEGLCRSLRLAGHRVLLVCTKIVQRPHDLELAEGSEADYLSPEFWASLNVELAVPYFGLQWPAPLAAMRQAGLKILSKADTDGSVGIRLFAKTYFRNSVEPARNPLDGLRRFKHFLHRWCRHRSEIGPVLTSVRLSDGVAVETEIARKNLTQTLRYYGASDQISKLTVMPHSVRSLFLDGDIPLQRPRKIFAGGRWDDDQKHPELLASTIRLLFKTDPAVEVVVAGSGDGSVFQPLVRSSPRFQWLGRISEEQVRQQLVQSRVLLSSSRWETHPVGALEALVSGCTIVGPPIPAFQELAAAGFARVSAKHSARSLAQAVSVELDRWECGDYAPQFIAGYWRSKVTPDALAKLIAGWHAPTVMHTSA